MAPRRSKSSKSLLPGNEGASAQFVFSVAAPTKPSAPVEFATNITPGTYKASTSKRSSSKPTQSKPSASAPKSFLPPEHVDDDKATDLDSQAKKPEDTNRIPRPPNAFILFRSSFIKGNHVDSEVETNHSTLSKIAGLTWNNLPEDQRQAWYDKAKDVKEAHKIKFPGYAFKPGARDRQRKGRTVGPKDEVRCQRIAQLLVEGVSGQELRSAMNDFDRHHVPEIVTRFEAPVTAKSFRRRRSSADTVLPQNCDDHPPPSKRRRKASPPPQDNLFPPTRSASPVDPDMPPLCDPPPSFDFSSSPQVFSILQDDSTQKGLNSFSFDQPSPASPPGSDYSYDNAYDALLSPAPTSPSCPSLPPKHLSIDTSFSPFDIGYPSSASASGESAPATPFFDEMAKLSFGNSGSFFYDAPLQSCDPSSLNTQYSPYSEYARQPAESVSCYLPQQKQQDDFLAAAYTALMQQHQAREDVSCHSPQNSMPMPNLDITQFMNMMTLPQQRYV